MITEAKFYVARALTLTNEKGIRNYTGQDDDIVTISSLPVGLDVNGNITICGIVQSKVPQSKREAEEEGKKAGEKEASVYFGDVSGYHALLNTNIESKTISRLSMVSFNYMQVRCGLIRQLCSFANYLVSKCEQNKLDSNKVFNLIPDSKKPYDEEELYNLFEKLQKSFIVEWDEFSSSKIEKAYVA